MRASTALELHRVLADARAPTARFAARQSRFDFWLVRQVRQAVRAGNPEGVIALHDVNRRSAPSLPRLIARIRQGLADEGLSERRDWKFTTEPDEVLDVLRRRTW